MFKKLFIVLLITIFFSNNVFALSIDQKKGILERFKQTQKENIFWQDEVQSDWFDWFFEDSQKISLLWSIKDKTVTKREYLEKQWSMIVDRVSSLEKSIESLDKDIQGKISEVNSTNAKIIEIKRDIDWWKKTIEFLKSKIKENRETLMDYITYIYKKWNYTFEWKEIDNIKSMLLNGEDIWEVINDLHFKSMIELSWQKLVEKHRSYVWSLYVKKIELESQEKTLKNLRKSLIIEKKVLDDKKEFKERILEITKWKETLFRQYVQDRLWVEKKLKIKELRATIIFNNAKNKLLEKYNCEQVDLSKVEDDLTLNMTPRCLDLNKVIYWESQLTKLEYVWSNPLNWPITPAYWISAYFHDEDYKKEIWDDHEAIDIMTPQGSSVRAPADWYVVYVNPPDSTDYSYVALKHSDWMVTVYWHLSEVLVKKYDFVNAWDIFAKSGWEFWTKWAWILTTWPHLHFEVFQNQEWRDPLSFLDTSYLAYDTLPEKYKYKFFDDYKFRKWYEYWDVTKSKRWLKVEWLTEIERQKSLIWKYAKWSFNNWSMWVEESLDWNVDPTFVMCIWIAETWLWNHTKTANNIWNVWNTDSWATKVMWSAREWVRSIIYTLNNKYLSKYNEIKELSRFWNKNWSIYASSDYNWHNNIVKCMSTIKQEYIPDDYNFRL